MSRIFRYLTFVAVFGNLGGKVPVVDEVLLSHEKEVYPTTSLYEFVYQRDRNHYVDFRQTFLALKSKLVYGRGYDTYNIE